MASPDPLSATRAGTRWRGGRSSAATWARLKATGRGSQNYAIPAGTDLLAFKSAVIWCRRFVVGFGVAPLSP